jgi:YVTN family beta-propeller protein
MPGTLGTTTVGAGPQLCRSDGEDVWVANHDGNSVTRVHGSDGQVVNTWPGISSPSSVLTAMGQILVTGQTPGNGSLYAISPGLPGFLTLTTLLGDSPMSIAFDGLKVWTANSSGSISIVTPTLPPWIVNTVSTGFSQPVGLVYDGAHIWVTDWGAGTLLKLDSSGVVIQTVTVGAQPGFATFDGSNIWVPNWGSNSVTVVRAATGEVTATLTGNALAKPVAAAFDGQRVAVTNDTVTPFDSLSLWRAADFAPLGFGFLGDTVHPYGICSDGVDFFVALNGPDQLVRF